MFNKRINIFTGHFGSGKTEVALNYALGLSQVSTDTAIVDFDIVNPYFRTTDAKDALEQRGIWVVTPMYANKNVDVPAIPAEINTLFENKKYKVVLDVGGDDLGARALSRYRDSILENDFELYFVINVRRPMTDTLEKIDEMIYDIELSSRLKITKLINNTNVLQYTKTQDIIEGHRLVEEVSKKYNIPIEFISCLNAGNDIDFSHIEEKTGTRVFKMEKHIKLPWE